MDRNLTLALTVCVLLASCTRAPEPVPAGRVCVAGEFSVDDDFQGARRGDCRVTGESTVRLDIRREDENVSNRSPWFAFRLTPTAPGVATVTLDYGDFEHRYVPKLSVDGLTWTPIDAVETGPEGRTATFDVSLDESPVFVSAQELLTPDLYDEWLEGLGATPSATVSLAGTSLEGRPISELVFDGPSDEVVLLTGRQHPPEVSGAIAMFAFVDTLAADTELATEFRQRFDVIALPLMNPDGVVHGHWRHGAGGMDLNRDWGTFSQPETGIVKQLLDELDANGNRLRYFLDFHSTNRNLFYTFPDDMLEDPRFFHTWFARAGQRLPDYPFSNENAKPATVGVGKNYVNERYGIVAATYEVGDETDRDIATAAAIVFAEEFMRLALER